MWRITAHPSYRTEQPDCHRIDLAAVHSAPTQRDQLAGRQSMRERCVGVQADSAHDRPKAARQLPLPRHRHYTHTTTFSPDTARRVHRETVSATTQADSVHGRHTAAQRFRLLTHPPLPPPSCHQQLSPGLPARAAAAPLLASTSLERDSTTDALPSTQQPGRRGQHQWSARTSDAAGSGPCRGR